MLRKHWWRFGLMALAVLGLGLGAWLVAPGLEVPLWAVIPATCACVLGAGWDQLAGTYYLVCGRDAEKWTSKELRKVCGPGWLVVDGISFAFHDVDHVVVGPGGVYAIETKCTDSSINLSSPRGRDWAARWADQAVAGARSIRLLLRDLDVDQVYPGVLVWGSEITGNPRFIDGVPVMRRKDLTEPWMPWRNGTRVLSDEDVRRIVSKLTEYRNVRLSYERSGPVNKAA